MAAELLLLNFNGPAGRKKGAVINIKYAPDDEEITWGKGERPPSFRIIRIEGVDEDTIDPDWKEFGGHRSKYVVNELLLTTKEKNDMEDPDGYRDGEKKPKKTKKKMSKTRLKNLKKSNALDWAAAHTTAEVG